MKIGILQTGRSPDELRAEHGDYDDLFKRLLSGRGFEFTTYAVLDGEMPDDPNEMEGWLITGSRHGAYEPHGWIPPLEEFLRRAYAAEVPIVGVCFGHQILAQALGGTVEKFEGGWSVGKVDYAFGERFHSLLAWHQDQVLRPPKDAKTVASSAFCQHAALLYGTRAFTIQPHPEFDAAFARDLLEARRGVLPPALVEDLDVEAFAEGRGRDFADVFETFFRERRLDLGTKRAA